LRAGQAELPWLIINFYNNTTALSPDVKQVDTL